MNPAALFKINQAMNQFEGTHPKFVAFLTTNIKVQQSDLELINILKDLK